MKILVLIALDEEYNVTKNKLWKKRDFYYQNGDLYLAYTGVGKVNAATVLTRSASVIKPDLVVNLGSACAVNNKLKQFDALWITTCQYLDFDLSAFHYQLNQVPHFAKLFVSTDNPLLIKWKESNKINMTAKQGSIDKFVDCHTVRNLADLDNIDLIDMELAAIAQAAEILNLPWCSIKLVSDLIGGNCENKLSYNAALPQIQKRIDELLISLAMINKNNL